MTDARERKSPKQAAGPPGRMRMLYDREADALSIELLPGARSARSTRPGILERLDFDAQDRLIAVEVLKASARYPLELLETLDSPIEELTLAQAYAESGLDPSTLRHQIAKGKLPARKVGRDWLLKGSDLMNYLENRAPSGRRSELEQKRRSKATRGKTKKRTAARG